MSTPQVISAAAVIGLLVSSVLIALLIRRRNLQYWLGGYIWNGIKAYLKGTPRRSGPVHVLLCIADHFEPAWGNPSDSVADARVDAWLQGYPKLLGGFRDSDGRPPRHTFFYPIDQYNPQHVDAIAGLCRDGFGEVEIHLHHDRDSAENLERTLREFTQLFADRHGVLGRFADGRVAYGFVHGNWALDNSRPDGCWCGVNNELSVLERTGCYADFTFPSAPDATQPRTINTIYYATGRENACKSHDQGVRAGTVPPPPGSLMLIQGPLGLTWTKGRLLPRIENGCLQRGQAPTSARLDEWLRANVHVPQRPDWVFVKLHTHGATEANQGVVLGDATVNFHRTLAERAKRNPNFHYHYVTAREMYNLAKAAESGWTGDVKGALDFSISSPRTATYEPPVILAE